MARFNEPVPHQRSGQAGRYWWFSGKFGAQEVFVLAGVNGRAIDGTVFVGGGILPDATSFRLNLPEDPPPRRDGQRPESRRAHRFQCPHADCRSRP